MSTGETFRWQNILTGKLITKRKHFSDDFFMTLEIYVFRNVLPFLGHLKVKSQTITVPHFSYQGMEHLL